MKEKDIALILIIVFVSGVFSFFVSNKFISSPEHNLEAAKVEPITTEFTEPSKAYFNDTSINPTQLIQIENNANQNPVKKTN